MSAALEPGMWVERTRGGQLRRGSLWCIAEIEAVAPAGWKLGCIYCNDETQPGLRLVNDPERDNIQPWCACGFRPIYRPKSETFRSLLQPSPERELLDA